jgi:predicted glycosyltransferase
LTHERRPATSMQRKIWIDLDNSPHVPLFVPIIDELRKRGYSVVVTARDCFQVCALADLCGVQYKRVGRHYGKSKALKVIGVGARSLQLLPTVLKERPDLALSHGSRSQILLCTLLRVPSIVMFDYEFVKGLGAIHPTWAMAPEVIVNSAAAKHHPAAKHDLLGYPGIKEDVYVPRFKPDPAIVADLGLDRADLVVTVRPPATEAHYHNPESEVLMDAVFELASKAPNTKIILLPRNKKQELEIRAAWPELFAANKIVVPDSVIDGLNLIWHSDLVISGGGTMNREAAALGVPVYTIFRGKAGAVDRYLAAEGRLVFIETPDDVRQKIVWKRRSRVANAGAGKTSVLSTIIDNVDFVAKQSFGGRR